MKKTLLALALAFTPSVAFADKPAPSGPVIGDPLCSLATTMTGITGYIGCFGSISDSPPVQNGDLVPYLNTNFSTYANWSYLGQSSDFNAIGNPLKANYSGGTSGTIEFDGPLTGIYGIGLKSATGSSVYVYNFNGVSSIAFSTEGTATNSQEDEQGLSHAMVFKGQGGGTNCVPGECCLGQGDNCNPVPEPNSYILMASGLAGLGYLARRRRTQA